MITGGKEKTLLKQVSFPFPLQPPIFFTKTFIFAFYFLILKNSKAEYCIEDE